MSFVSLDALGITLGSPLFQDLSLTVARGDRIGLVAANGRGKTTLLNCLSGRLEPTAGGIVRSRGMRTALLRQDPPERLLALNAV